MIQPKKKFVKFFFKRQEKFKDSRIQSENFRTCLRDWIVNGRLLCQQINKSTNQQINFCNCLWYLKIYKLEYYVSTLNSKS